jgi:hypothetical protein
MINRRYSIPVVLITALLSVACHREPAVVAADAAGGVGPQAFNGQAFRSRNGNSAIVLVSREELEYTTGGTTFLCKYSEQGDGLRVIFTALGTQQVLYFRRVPGGLQSNDGVLFLNKAGLQEAERLDQLRQRQEEAARLAAERQRAESERLAALEAQRQADERRVAEEQARKEAPGKLRALLETHPLLHGTYATGFGDTAIEFTVESFNPVTGAVSASLYFPSDHYNGKHTNHADGTVSGDTLNLTVYQDVGRKDADKPWIRMRLQFNGLTRTLAGAWFDSSDRPSERGSPASFRVDQ